MTPDSAPARIARMNGRWVGAGAVLFAFALLGCASAEEIGGKVDDLWLATKVRSRLAAGAVGQQFKINVDVKDGVVTLRGRVDTEEDKRKIEELITPLRGVERVDNRLLVGDEPAPEGEAEPEPAPRESRRPAYF